MPARPAHRGGPPGGLRWSDTERALHQIHGSLLAAVDEVGRGPLAGPVIVCALVMPPDAPEVAGVDDSKRLAPAARARADAAVRAAVAWALGAASAREVDALNVYHATTLAMRRALAGLAARLGRAPDHVLVDGRPVRALGTPHTAVVGGDGSCYAVACASVVAKEARDRLMRALAVRHPAYAWERNAGYGTAAHRSALVAHGPTPHHRRSFLGSVPGISLPGDSPPGDSPPEPRVRPRARGAVRPVRVGPGPLQAEAHPMASERTTDRTDGPADAGEANARGQRYGGTDEAGDMAPARRGGVPGLAGVRPPPTGTSGTPASGGTGPVEAPPPSPGAARKTGVADAPTTPGAGTAVSYSDAVDDDLGPTDAPAAGA